MMKRVEWFFMFAWLVACGTTPVESETLSSKPVVEVTQAEVPPIDPCENAPPHDCCPSTTPQCNKCRATYEGFIRECPDAVDKRIRVPVETNMEWTGDGRLPTQQEDTHEMVLEDVPDGIHFRGDSELSGKSFLTCDELEESLCCRGESPDCISCRMKARSVVSQCRSNGEGGIQILHSPVGIPGQMNNDRVKDKKSWGQTKPPGLQ